MIVFNSRYLIHFGDLVSDYWAVGNCAFRSANDTQVGHLHSHVLKLPSLSLHMLHIYTLYVCTCTCSAHLYAQVCLLRSYRAVFTGAGKKEVSDGSKLYARSAAWLCSSLTDSAGHCAPATLCYGTHTKKIKFCGDGCTFQCVGRGNSSTVLPVSDLALQASWNLPQKCVRSF